MPVVCLKMHTNRCKCSRRGQTSTLLVLKWKRVSGIPAGPCMVFSGDLRRRELQPCTPDLLGGNRSHGNADCDISRESGTNLTSFYGCARPKRARPIGGIICTPGSPPCGGWHPLEARPRCSPPPRLWSC